MNILLEREKLKKELLLSENIINLNNKYNDEVIDKLLFDYKTNYKILALDYKYLNKIDFINISFDNADVTYTNFNNLNNVILNLQKIYNKSIKKTKLNGVMLIGNYNDVTITGADFNGAIGNTHIDPSIIKDKDLSYCKFNGITFINNFDGCNINNSDFKGSKNAFINPQKLKKVTINACKPNLKYIPLNDCIFDDVTFTGTFHSSDVTNSDFSNSKGKVNLSTVFFKNNFTKNQILDTNKRKIKILNLF